MILWRRVRRGIEKIVRKVRCARLNSLIDSGGGYFDLPDAWMPVSINKAGGSRLIAKGRVTFVPWGGGGARTFIRLAEGSSLEFGGHFEIGQGVKLDLSKDATLRFGGRKNESGSGITCDTTILVHRRVDIGSDFMCAWGVFISDCDWHDYAGKPSQADVFIGDKVWVSHQSSILKGVVIPEGCIVAAHSLVLGGEFTANGLIAGNPAQLKKTGIFWHRDMASSALNPSMLVSGRSIPVKPKSFFKVHRSE